MGGSSAVNYLVYMRGHRLDYDEWAELGNHGWSYREVFFHFYKIFKLKSKIDNAVSQ